MMMIKISVWGIICYAFHFYFLFSSPHLCFPTDPDRVLYSSNLIDDFQERSRYPAAPFTLMRRTKRLAVYKDTAARQAQVNLAVMGSDDPLVRNDAPYQYVDPILAELGGPPVAVAAVDHHTIAGSAGAWIKEISASGSREKDAQPMMSLSPSVGIEERRSMENTPLEEKEYQIRFETRTLRSWSEKTWRCLPNEITVILVCFTIFLFFLWMR